MIQYNKKKGVVLIDMNIFKTIIDFFTNGLISDINKYFYRKKDEINVLKMTSLKTIYFIIFTICFLSANFTAMLAILFKYFLGRGIIFPIASCILLYSICIASLLGVYTSNKEREFFVKKIEFDKNEE